MSHNMLANEAGASRAWYQHCRKWMFWVRNLHPESSIYSNVDITLISLNFFASERIVLAWSLVCHCTQGHKIDSPKMSSRGTRGHKEEETAAGWSGVHIHHGSPQCRASKRQTQKKFLSFRTKNVCEEERFADSLISAVIRCVRSERVSQNISWDDNENVVLKHSCLCACWQAKSIMKSDMPRQLPCLWVRSFAPCITAKWLADSEKTHIWRS